MREAALRRLLEAVDPALVRLRRLLDSDDERVTLQAIRLVLDRAGIVTEQGFVITPAMIEAEIARLEAELGRPQGSKVMLRPFDENKGSLDQGGANTTEQLAF